MSAWPLVTARHMRWLNSLERGGVRVLVRHDADEREWTVLADGAVHPRRASGPTLLAATSSLRKLFARALRARRQSRGG